MVPGWKVIVISVLGLLLGFYSSAEARIYSKQISQGLTQLQENILENTNHLKEISSQMTLLQQQNAEILSLLKKGSKYPPNRTLEARLEQMHVQIEELKIQVQLLFKALIVLIGVLVLILLYMLFRSRRPSRPGSIRL